MTTTRKRSSQQTYGTVLVNGERRSAVKTTYTDGSSEIFWMADFSSEVATPEQAETFQ